MLQDKLDYDPLDCTKVWEEEKYPLVEVGRMVLNKNPSNFFTDNEQLAFSPSNVVPGAPPPPQLLFFARLNMYVSTCMSQCALQRCCVLWHKSHSSCIAMQHMWRVAEGLCGNWSCCRLLACHI